MCVTGVCNCTSCPPVKFMQADSDAHIEMCGCKNCLVIMYDGE